MEVTREELWRIESRLARLESRMDCEKGITEDRMRGAESINKDRFKTVDFRLDGIEKSIDARFAEVERRLEHCQPPFLRASVATPPSTADTDRAMMRSYVLFVATLTFCATTVAWAIITHAFG